jgi:hypothetical protein
MPLLLMETVRASGTKIINVILAIGPPAVELTPLQQVDQLELRSNCPQMIQRQAYELDVPTGTIVIYQGELETSRFTIRL